MPHARMEIHDALYEANGALRSYDAEAVAATTDLTGVAEVLGLSGDVTAAIGRLHPVVGAGVHAAIRAAASDGGRPVYLSWHHGPIQRLHVTAPAAAGTPVDVQIESRYDEDGLAGPLDPVT